MSTQGGAPSDVMLSIIKTSSFIDNQPAGWSRDNNFKLRCDDQAVTVLAKDKRFLGGKTAIEIGSQADLDNFMQMVNSKPILTTARCSKPYSYGTGGQVEHDDHVEEYVVMINTRHQQVQQLFHDAYEKTKQLISEDKKFRVTISISESLKIWFIQNVPMSNQNDYMTYATDCDIYLVNGTSEPSFADHCFSCEFITQKLFWCVCLPFFLLCFLPFRIYKSCIIGIIETEIKRALPVTYHDTAYPNGFSIMLLLYPPGTTFTTYTTTTYYQQPVVQQQPYQQQPHQ